MEKNTKNMESNISGLGETNFPEMLEHSPLAIYFCNAEGGITYFNETAAQLWGRKPIIDKEKWFGAWKSFSPDGAPMPADDFPAKKLVSTPVSSEKFEIRIQRPKGDFRNLLIYQQSQYDTSDNFLGYAFTMVDITRHEKDDIKQATLSAIVDSSDDAIISKDLNGTIISWNAGAERIFGYSETEILGKSITILIPKNRLQEEEEIIGKLKKGERVKHIETLRLDKSGREIPLSITISPVKDRFGNVAGASKVARPISERMKSEEKNAILSAIVESSDDAIISKTLTGTITSWNRGASLIFGYSEAETIGKSIKMLIPKSRLKEENVIIDQIKKGVKVDHIETLRLHKNGNEIPLSITISPIKDSRGKIIGASKVARDISLQVQAQEALEQYTHNLESLNSVGKTISASLNVSDIVESVIQTTAALTGAGCACFYLINGDETQASYQLTASTCVTESISALGAKNVQLDWFLPTGCGKISVRINDLREHAEFTERIEKIIPLKNLENCSYMAVPVISKEETVTGVLVFTHPEKDIFTAEHEQLVINIAAQTGISLDNSSLYEQVRSLSEKKDEFIALASHELKTPLTTIKGYLQVLAKMKVNHINNLFVDKSLHQVNKLNTLIEDILNMSRIENGRLDFNLEVFDLRLLLQELLETFKFSTHSHNIITSLGDAPTFVEADKQRIEQAIINLITNAIKYSPFANAIYVTLEVTDGKVRLGVRDEGMGLTELELDQLFTRFYRAETTKGISGLGLGLYLTKQIIDRHKGEITVKSEYGKGSEFVFTLPLKTLKLTNEMAG